MPTYPPTIDWESELLAHREWMLSLAQLRLRDPSTSEDVVQEVALSIVNQNPQLEDPQKIRSWLYQAVVRQTADYLRKHYRRQRVTDEASLHREPSELRDGLHWLLASEQRELLREALNRLPPDDREIMLLKFNQNWNYKQLSARLGVTERAVEYRLVCAKRQLRAELSKLRGDTHD